jgi:hypothetical protein
MDLKLSINDPYLFIYPSSAFILVYIDDLLLMAKNLELINKLASLLSANTL